MEDRPAQEPFLGGRFTVRRVLSESGIGALIGVLLAIDEPHLVLEDRHGVRHRVRRADIIATRRVPDVPPIRRRTDLTEL